MRRGRLPLQGNASSSAACTSADPSLLAPWPAEGGSIGASSEGEGRAEQAEEDEGSMETEEDEEESDDDYELDGEPRHVLT